MTSDVQGTEPLALARRVNQVCDQFELAWKAGRHPCIEDYLADLSKADRAALLRELVPLEIDYRRLRGDKLRPEEYQRRFPALERSWLAGVFDPALKRDEGEQVVHAGSGHHVLCPHCRSPVPIGDAATLEELLCPSCGSTFRLDQNTPTIQFSVSSSSKLGKFELLETLGTGAFGTVYKAHDPELDRIVAIKVPRSPTVDKGAPLDRFLREARSVAQLRHPSIVPVYEVGQHDGLPYLVSEFVEGVTLADWLTAHRPVPREAAQLIATIADALHYAHEHGVVHRDVKPSNIMLSPVVAPGGAGGLSGDGEKNPPAEPGAKWVPFVMDFGLAKRDAGEITMTLEGQVLGTPAYMSPEQARGDAHLVDGRSDVYSLGVIFYELLTGELPFRGNARMQMHQVLHDEPRSPRRLNDIIPRDLETICLKALAKTPNRRYLTARALAEDLQRWLNGEPILARPVGKTERLWRWCRRNPALATVSGLAAAALIAVATISSVASIYFAYLSDSLATARGVADQNARDADQKAKDEKKARADADAKEKETRRQFGRVNVAYGTRLRDEGDLFGSLPWFAQALTLDRDDPAREETHRFRVAAVLEECPKLVRVWVHDESRHGAELHSAEFSPDGRYVVAIGNGRAQMWDALTGESLNFLKEAGNVGYVSFSPDSRWIVTSGRGQPARVWNVATGEPVTLPLKESGFVELYFTPDGRKVVTASKDGMTRVWDVATGEPLTAAAKLPADVQGVAFSRDSRQAVTGSNEGMVRIWDLATGNVVATLQHKAGVPTAVFSPDGRRVLTAGVDGTVTLWDVGTGKATATVATSGPDRPFASFSPDGQRFVTAVREGARVWEAATGKAVTPPLTHSSGDMGVRRAVFSPDGRHVATAGTDFTARVWDATTGEPVTPFLKHGGKVSQVAFSPDGRWLLTASWDHTVRIWDLAPADPAVPPFKHGATVYHADFSPDGRRVVTASHDSTARVWDATSGQPVTPPLKHDNGLWHAAFSPDGRRVATASQDGTARVWDADTGKQLTSVKHDGPVKQVRFSPDGRWILTASDDKTARLWDAATGQPVGTPLTHDENVLQAMFSADGRLVVTVSSARAPSKTGAVRVWVAASGQPVTPPVKHSAAVSSAALSPDAQRLVTACANHFAFVIDVGTGKTLFNLGHGSGVDHAAFSPDGRRVVTASRDQTARVWDAATGEPVTPPLKHNDDVVWASFTPDGRRILTLTREGTARFWDAATSEPLTPPLKHWGNIQQMAFSPDGKQVVAACKDAARVWNVPREERPVEDLVRLAEVLSGQQIENAGEAIGFVPLKTAQLRSHWETLQAKYPHKTLASPEQLASHEREAEAALKKGQWDTALKHLNLLIDARPQEPRYRADRGRIHSQQQQWDKAIADYSVVVEKNQNDGAAWQRRGYARAKLGQWDEAAADYAKALPLLVDDGRTDAPRKQAALELAQWDEVFTKVAGLRPNETALWIGRARYYALRGDWSRAAPDYAKVIASRPIHDECFEYACLLLLKGDAEGYQQFCQEAMKRAGQPPADPFVAYALARTCAISPLPSVGEGPGVRGIDPALPVQWAEQAVQNKRAAFYLHALGLAHYRAGQFDQALQRLQESNVAPWFEGGKLLNWLLLALVHHRLGQPAEVWKCLDQARPMIQRATPTKQGLATPLPPPDWLELQVLRREVEATLQISLDPSDATAELKLLERAVADYAKASESPTADAELRLRTASTYQRLGESAAKLRSYDKAREAHGKAIPIFDKLAAEFPTVPDHRDRLARNHYNLAEVCETTRQYPEAEKAYRQAMSNWEKLVAEFSDKPEFRNHVPYTYARLGNVLQALQRRQEAEAAYRQAIALWQQLATEFPSIPGYQVQIGGRSWDLGGVLKAGNRPEEAEKAYRQALTAFERLAADYPTNPYYRQEQAWSCWLLAQVLKDVGRLKEAEELHRQALAIHAQLVTDRPNTTEYRIRLCRSYVYLAELLAQDLPKADAERKAAIEAFFAEGKKALREQAGRLPDNPGTHNNFAWNLAVSPGSSFLDPELVVELAQKAVEKSSQTGIHWNTLGVALYRAGKWKEAIEALRKADELYAASYFGHDALFLAMCHWQLGDKEQAGKWYAAADLWMDRFNPTNDELVRFRVEAAALLGLPDPASRPPRKTPLDEREVYTRIVEADPTAAWAYSERGQLHHRIGRYQEAVSDFSKVLELKPNDWLAQAWRGGAYSKLKQWDLAIPDFSKAIELNPKIIWVWQHRGDAYARSGQADKAKDDFAKAAELAGNDVQAWSSAARTYMGLEQYDEAVRAYGKLTELTPEDYSVWNYRGNAYFRMRQFDKAVPDYTQAIERRPDYAVLWSNRGTNYAELGQWDKAAADYAKAIELPPQTVDTWNRRALALLAAGDAAGYRKLCADMVKQFGTTASPLVAGSVAWTCALGPDCGVDANQVLALAEKAATSSPKNYTYARTLGAAQLRAGKHEAAIKQLDETIALRPGDSPGPWLLLALAHHHAGHATEAHQWLDKAATWIDQAPQKKPEDGSLSWANLPWQERLVLQLLRKEAEGLIKATPPKPKDQ